MAEPTSHLIGLLLGTERDWPRAFETIAGRLGTFRLDGADHRLEVERITIEPFNLRDRPRQDLVIDRVEYWYLHPREWLKKIALMDDVYLLNSPFTFQSMEKHAAYCALLRLGMHVPDTVLLPHKNPVENERWDFTAQHYNLPFDLQALGEQLGYPLFMKPFDGGGWRGVSRIDDPASLQAAYDSSGDMLMHLQAGVEPFDVFTRALTIGPETRVLKFRPDLPMHDRYEVAHDFLDPQLGTDAVAIAQTVNAFFRWEFNSCEMMVQGDRLHPIDFANAIPDVALTSLHYYWPWAMAALVRWSAFCVATQRTMRAHVDSAPWFAIADDPDLDEAGRLAGYQDLADRHFERERYDEAVAGPLAAVDEVVHEWIGSPDFDDLLVDTVRTTYPDHEHERFIAHFRGLVGAWHTEQS